MVLHSGWRLALMSSQEPGNPEMALSSDSSMAEVPKMEGVAAEPQVLVGQRPFVWTGHSLSLPPFLPSPRPGLTAIFPSFSPILVLLAVWCGRVGKVARLHPEWERGNTRVSHKSPWESHFCVWTLSLSWPLPSRPLFLPWETEALKFSCFP